MDLSEPERATARFQAVLSSLLAPGRGARLFVHGPSEARLQLGADGQRGVPVVAQVLLSDGDDEATLQRRLRPLLDELAASRAGEPDKRFYLRILVVTPPADAERADAVLRAVAAAAPPAPALQVFHLSSDGTIRTPSSLIASELGPALREQPKLALALLPEAEFAARCEQAAQQTRQHLSQARELAQVLQTRRTPVTFALLALNLALLGLTYLWGGPEVSATLGRMGAAAPARILAGQWWRLLAATALHGGLAHLMFNSLALWNLGVLLERLLGSARFVSLYVLAGLGGNLLGVALTGFGDFSSSVGASGAICGLLGAAAALGWRPRGELPLPVAQSLKRMAMLNLGLTAVVSLQAHVDWRAHLGGALAGAVLTLLGLVRPTVRPPTLGTPRWRERAQLGLSVVAGTLLLGSIGTAIARGQPWLLAHPEQRQRIALGRALSLEVPRSFGTGQPGTGGEGSLSLVFDDLLESPAELTVIVVPHPTPLLSAGEREHAAELQWQAVEQNAQAREQALSARRLTVADLPALELARTFPSGGRVQQLLQVRAGHSVKLRLRVPAGTPSGMTPPLEELLRTLREEPR